MLSILCVDYGVRLADAWQMTRTQVRLVYLRERDDKGRPVPPPGKAKPAVDPLRQVRRLQGWPEHKIDEALAAAGRR